MPDSAVTTGYFQHARTEIAPLLPADARSILDVGAGAGRVCAWVRDRYSGSRSIALEGNSAMLPELTRHADQVHIVDLNGALPECGTPDLILLLDVLEHLTDPPGVLRALAGRMARGGTVIVSLPNVAHLSVSAPLFLRAAFTYEDAGILDRTHLHFFVRRSVIALMNQAGLIVRQGLRFGFNGPRSKLLYAASFGLLPDHLTKQYIVAGTRAGPGETQGEVSWQLA